MSIPTLDGITEKQITSARLTTRVLFSGADDGIPVVFVHGNLSSATWWEEAMLSLPDAYRGIAYDLRGFGSADPEKFIDATSGMGDLSDDLAALMDALAIDKAHVVGNSLGSNVLWRFMMDFPDRIRSVIQINPGSPYGVGGTHGADGEPIHDDFAGSGQGLVNPLFIEQLKIGDRTTDSPFSPRNLLPRLWSGTPEREEELLTSMLSIHLDDKSYAADIASSENWPGFAPGKWGVSNALSPKYLKKPDHLYDIEPKPPVLWIRGENDQTVSDHSLMDYAVLGKMGLIPSYPGEDSYPKQLMVSQTRNVLTTYQNQGGHFEEVIIADGGHALYIDQLEQFNQHFHSYIINVDA